MLTEQTAEFEKVDTSKKKREVGADVETTGREQGCDLIEHVSCNQFGFDENEVMKKKPNKACTERRIISRLINRTASPQNVASLPY